MFVDKMPTRQYKNTELVDIPSGLGGVLPAAIAEKRETESTVICLHPHFYTNWVLTVDNKDLKPISSYLSDDMAKIIDSRLNS